MVYPRLAKSNIAHNIHKPKNSVKKELTEKQFENILYEDQIQFRIKIRPAAMPAPAIQITERIPRFLSI